MAEIESPDWDQIIELHAKRVFGVAMRILGSVQEAEDVSQDVFIEAYNLHQKGSVQSWTGLLVRLATLRSIDRRRRRRMSRELRETDNSTTSEPCDELVASELAVWLRDAIRRLPDQQATVFTMHHFEELDREAISASLGISLAAVSTALCKARRQLMAEFTRLSKGSHK